MKPQILSGLITLLAFQLTAASPVASQARVDPAPSVQPTNAPEPLICTKICASGPEALNCGKGWRPHNPGGGVSDCSLIKRHEPYSDQS